jgi:hypothetical protein
MDQKTIREYCVRCIAEIIYENFALAPGETGPRDKLDWETAEEYVDASPKIQAWVRLKLKSGTGYEEFKAEFGRTIRFAFLNCSGALPRPPYAEIIDT